MTTAKKAGPAPSKTAKRARTARKSQKLSDSNERKGGSGPQTKYTAEQYFLEDYEHTFFPLTSTELLVQKFPAALRSYYERNPFRPQTRCSAAKRGFHLRRTVKLDPPTELFIYDLVYRNRKQFRADHTQSRTTYGFLLRDGKPVSPIQSYQAYQAAISDARKAYPYGVKFDICSYFNSLYHHDLVSRLREIGADEGDVELYGRFLREINSGRSLDCLPHGLHPCKVLGSDFLKFIDNSMKLKSERFIRFLDDFWLFSKREEDVQGDFNAAQELLSDKGLYLNEGKTAFGPDFGRSVSDEVDDIKAELLRARRQVFDASGIRAGSKFTFRLVGGKLVVSRVSKNGELNEADVLEPRHTDYLLELLKNPDIDESDAELVLVLLRDHGETVLEKMGSFPEKFPGLTRTIYQFSSSLSDKQELCSLILKFLRGGQFATEYQLFWITKMLEDRLSDQNCYGTALALLSSHPASTAITRSKLLEIPEHRFGMPDLRETALRSGQCDWPSWAAAIGCRAESAAKRNHLLGYFENAGPMNRLIGECSQKL
jgi:hypothetical protein